MYSDFESLRNLILRLLNEKGLTVNKLAALSGLTQSTLDSILKGKSKNPKIQTMRKISDGLNIPYDEFIRLLRSEEVDRGIELNHAYDKDSSLEDEDQAMIIAGEKLKQLRLDKGITMLTVAKELGVSPDYELGQFGDTPLDTLIALADYFDVSLDYLVGRSDDPQRH